MNMPNSRYESILKLKGLYCIKSSTSRSSEQIDGESLELSVGRTVKCEDDNFLVTVGLKVNSQDGSFNAEVVMRGIFAVDNSESSELSSTLTEKNAVAIVFPYVRSHMTLITSQPGMSPVIVPPLNINAWINEDDDYSIEE